MAIHIDEEKFEIARELFKKSMLEESNGVPFENFQHPFLVKDEIKDKWQVYRKARKALSLDNWRQWLSEEGKIIEVTKNACKQSSNLLYIKSGEQKSSQASLYIVNDSAQIKGLENQLFNFFLGGASIPTEFGSRFDSLADYLRDNKLPCPWPFLSYLAFLLDPLSYFHVRPQGFDKLLQFFGIGKTISRYVSWERYSILLELAEVVKSKLAADYGEPNMIETHSYMWVVANLISSEEMGEDEG